jgi:predicted porin
MKKIKACVVALAGYVTTVHAQNSVTLYGIADQGLQLTTPTAAPGNHGVRTYQLVNAGIEWGLQGVEELGEGMQAVFRLENGSGSTDSTSNLEFGRIAYLGLASKQYGTLTIGHDWDVIENYLGKFTANDTWGGPTFSHPLDNDNTNGDFGVDNGVKYTSPIYLGLQLGAMYGFSNATAFANDRLYGLGLLYSKGPLSAAAAYEEINEPDSATNSTNGAVPSSSFLFTAQHQRILGVGATWLLGRSTVGIEYTNTGVFAPTGSTYIANVGAPSALKFNNIEVKEGLQKSWR